MAVTFLDMQNKALARVDETVAEADAEVLSVVKDAINNGYMLLRGTVDKRTTTLVADYDKKITLPADFISTSMVEHDTLGELNPTSYEKIDDFLYFKSRDIDSGELSITYAKYPVKLANDTDTLELNEAFVGPLAAFGAYTYQLYRKKYGAAQLLLQEFSVYIPTKAPQMPETEKENQNKAR